MNDDVPLREHVDAMFAEKEKALQAALLSQEKAVTAALNASEKAITKAEANAEKWRENANEWRGAMNDRDRELPSRREVAAEFSAVKQRVGLLERGFDTNNGQDHGVHIVVAYVIGASGVAIAALTLILK